MLVVSVVSDYSIFTILKSLNIMRCSFCLFAYLFIFVHSDPPHHHDPAPPVFRPPPRLSVAPAAAKISGGDMHQDPGNDRWEWERDRQTDRCPALFSSDITSSSSSYLSAAKSRSISLPLDLESHISSMLSSSALNSLSRSNPNYKSLSRTTRTTSPSNPWDYKNIIEKLQVTNDEWAILTSGIKTDHDSNLQSVTQWRW